MKNFSLIRFETVFRSAVLIQALLFAFFVAGSHNAFVRLPQPTTTDFASFYAAGRLAESGRAASAYDVPAHRAVEEQVTAPGIDYKYFFNPPPFLLICAPLAALPYLAAFVVFEALTLAFWLLVGTRIAGGGRVVVLALLATPSLYWALGWGQNSFLTAGLMGLGTLLLGRRPGLAGAAFGALAIKPHFGVLLPVALVCGRQWRAVAAAAATFIALAALSAALFGLDSWSGFFHALTRSGLVQLAGHVDAGGAARLLGAGRVAAWAIQAAASLAACCIVGWIWLRRPAAVPGQAEARMAALLAGTLVAMPFLLFYDLVLASVAAAWIAAAARRSAWMPGEGRSLAMVFALALLDFPAAAWLHAALGCLVGPALLALSVRRVMQPVLTASPALSPTCQPGKVCSIRL
jgi:hypothetical protein